MDTYFYDELPYIKEKLTQNQAHFKEVVIQAKTTLLLEGDIANYLYFINEGCLRTFFNDEGKDITFQFFFEHQVVCSFESFQSNEASLFTIETIEDSKVTIIKKSDFLKVIEECEDLKEHVFELLSHRFIFYMKLFLSRIKDSPEKRYLELKSNHPEILDRVPHHYIASYLGITPVSLSRIRKRILAN